MDKLALSRVSGSVEMICSTNEFVLGKPQVYSIRDAAANNLKRLAEEFGPEWALQHIIPQVILLPLTFANHLSLLAQMCGLSAAAKTRMELTQSTGSLVGYQDFLERANPIPLDAASLNEFCCDICIHHELICLLPAVIF